MWEWLMAMSCQTVARAIEFRSTVCGRSVRKTRPAPHTVTLPGSGYIIERGNNRWRALDLGSPLGWRGLPHHRQRAD